MQSSWQVFRPAVISLLIAFSCFPILANKAGAQVAPASAPPGLEADFEAFMTKFKAAVSANDVESVTRMTRMPFYHDMEEMDADEFRSKGYQIYFTQKARACILHNKGIYRLDWDKNHNFLIPCDKLVYIFMKTPASFLFVDVDFND